MPAPTSQPLGRFEICLRKIPWLGLVLVALLAWSATPVDAHPAGLSGATVTIDRDGRMDVVVTFDVLAFALNDLPERVADTDMTALLDGPTAVLQARLVEAERHFRLHYHATVDGTDLPVEALKFPTVDGVRKTANSGGARLPVLATCDVTQHVPPGVHTIRFRFPEVMSSLVVSIDRPDEDTWTEVAAAGAPTSPLKVRVQAGAGGSAAGSGRPAVARNATADWLRSMFQFVELGFTHILPRGLDHILFVLGLFLLSSRLSTLLTQITSFTVAHSVTLGLSLYGVIRVSPAVIEPLIALSIVLVAVDNLRGTDLRWWRLAVVFGFGLVHGMGFAGALRDLGLPRHEFLRALIGFNFGVELGQLAVVALAFAAVGWFRASPRYRQWVVVPASAAIAVVALVWTIERVV
ncbi:MAG TPA: HupE/UreJ family protein [Opitutaceae bacterium]|nr:HupE/UreJ family protein [Opitutaceae bacterium]